MTQKSYEMIPCEGYVTFKLTGNLEATQVSHFEKELETVMTSLTSPLDLVIQCDNISELPTPWTKSLIQVSKQQKSKNKQIRLVLCTDKVRKSIRDAGLDKVLICSQTLRHALIDFGMVTGKALDVNFINPFLDAAMKVLSIQAQITVTPGKIYRKEDSFTFMGDISGVIGLVSEVFSGSVVVTFPAATFLKIMSNMLGETFTELNKDIEDGAAEITNMIFGHAKTQLNEKGYGIKTALPSIIVGKDHTVKSLSQGPHFVVPFESTAGAFYVEICLSA